MAACEECWTEANRRALTLGGHAVDHYKAALAEHPNGHPEQEGPVAPDEIERQRQRGWPDFHPEDFCHRCGRPNCSWWAASDAWNVATANVERGRLTVLCPPCFMTLWHEETGLRVSWEVRLDIGSGDVRRALYGDRLEESHG